ncbi:MAG: inverse autotransporter beta domain-containing protein, partial [Alphaproteobacteria bacterium]|nr:inverse autotransporter beta domain-containing protein [Alphaproteobacteria bacterium]
MNNWHDVARAGIRTATMLRGFRAARRLALASTVSMIALGIGAAAAQETAETGADGARWSAHGSVTARVGTERHIGELDLFLPLWQSESSMLYGDLRTQTDDAGNMEGNAGLGFRTMGESWIVGGYGFFDYRKSDETGNTFSQGMLGFEALSETMDLRANAYIPEGAEQAAASA